MNPTDYSMIRAINKGKEWHSGQTSVTVADETRRVWVTGINIAVITHRVKIALRDDRDPLMVRRLNAVLKGLFGDQYALYANKRSTYVVYPKRNRFSGKISLGHTYLTLGVWWEVEGPDLPTLESRRTVGAQRQMRVY